MKKILWLFLSVPILLQGCRGVLPAEQLTGLIYERGNGSVWGEQLYISLTEDRILALRYMPEGSSQVETREQLPITPEQWQSVTRLVSQLNPERARPSLFDKLFPRQDGSDFYRLTLVYGEKEIPYRLPAGAEELEALLEQLVREVTQ